MRLNRKYLAALLISVSTVFAISCSDGSTDTTDLADTVGETSPPDVTPTVDPSTEDEGATAGPVSGASGSFRDDNLDGIRDDVNVFIDDNYSASTPVKMVAERLARGMQNLLDAESETEAATATEIIQLAIECAFDHLYPNTADSADQAKAISLKTEIVGATVNTRERVDNYYAANEILGGSVYELRNPTADECF